MTATMSILGLLSQNNELLSEFALPAAVDRDILTANLMVECGELEVLYPNADFMQIAIGAWSNKMLNVWTELENTLHYEYNPIENYDRVEEWTNSETGTNESSGTSSATSTTNTDNISTDASTAFNSDGFKDTHKNTLDGTVSGSDTNEGSSNQAYTGSSTHTARIRGNIGVTTSQQMIEAQRRVVEFNIYDVIISDFRQQFCLLVY